MNSSSGSPTPSSVTPAVQRYSWKSSLVNEFLGVTSGEPSVLKNVYPMSSNPNADAAGRVLNNTLISAEFFLLPAKKSFIDVAGFSSAIPFVKYI